ncbi:MAG: hypothetical protein ISP74_06040 [Bacteroidia bacterium]|nr:hypothetical protein [Bacteroidia bacterium]
MIRAFILLLVYPLWSDAYQKELITLPSNSDISILYVGDYMKGEIDINLMSKEWWGIFEDNKQSFIKKVEIKLEKIEPDIQYDWEYRVSVENEKKCIFLLTGLNLSDKTFNYFTTQDVIRDSEVYTFEFDPYNTFISSELKSLNFIGVPRKDYSFFLNYQTQDILKTQELFIFPSYDSYLYLSLIWAGDIDNDGKTDFLINIPTPPNNEFGFSSGLFLSSKAESNELVKLVAFHIQRGC